MATRWTEIGERVFVRRYAFFDQNIVVVLGSPVVGVVVNSHGHYDHVFGNSVFRPAPIWGHERAAEMLRRTGDRQREGAAAEVPEIAAELAAVVLDPADRTFREV